MPNRRSVLLGVWGLAAEIGIGLAVLPLVLPSETASATTEPATPDRIRHFRYRGRLVAIWESGAMVMASVDGRMVHVDRSRPQSYHSHILPFRDFATLPLLIRTLIDMACDRLVIL
ncbi:MAG: hypothetical protein ABWZ98_03065 [Nakamurella sp.]